MPNNRLFNVLVVVALVVVAALTARLVAATAEVISDPSGDAAGALDNHERSASQNTVDHARSYRSPLDECFDVPLSEAAGCRNASQTPVQSMADHTYSYRSPLDECFDVPLSEPCDE